MFQRENSTTERGAGMAKGFSKATMMLTGAGKLSLALFLSKPYTGILTW